MTPTVAELREIADANGVDLGSRTRKADIEDALRDAGVSFEEDDTVSDEATVIGDDDMEAVAEAIAAEVNADLPPPPSPPTIMQREEATYDRYRVDGAIDYRAVRADVPDRPGLPRHVREMDIPQLQTAIRMHTYRKEERQGNLMALVTVFYDLPDDHDLSAAQLQDLLMAMMESDGPPFPAWESFRG